MGKVYQLPRAAKPAQEPLKAVSGCPDSDLYAVVKSGGSFQVVSKSSGVVQYTAAKKDWAIDWIVTNDETVRNVEAA